MQQETTYAEQNAKRFRQVNEAFRKPDFETIVNIVDFLMVPLDAAIDKLLSRTSQLKSLRFHESDITGGAAAEAELEAKVRKMFLDWADGSFGLDIIGHYMRCLRTGQLAEYCSECEQPAMFETCFQLLVFGITDVWKRYCYAVQCFPYKMFAFATCDECTFENQWLEFRRTLHQCPSCIDCGFGTPLLKSVDLSSLEGDAKAGAIKEVQELLSGIATFCPLATDMIENQHGQNQNDVSRFRGKSKAPPSAAEASVLARLRHEHAYMKASVMHDTLPKRFGLANMQRQLGRRNGIQPRETRKARVNKAAHAKRRKLAPWNVFVKQQLQQCQKKLNKVEYTEFMKQCGKDWKSMADEDKKSFSVEAAYQQSIREELHQRPLASAGEDPMLQAPDPTPSDSVAKMSTLALEKQAGKRYCKKVSAKRLLVNSSRASEHSIWSRFGLGLADTNGALRSELIDLGIRQTAIDFSVDFSLHRKVDNELLNEIPLADAGSDAHSSTCLEVLGFCVSHPHADFAVSFARALSKLTVAEKLEAGTLVKVTPVIAAASSSSATIPELFVFLRLLSKKPLLHVLAQAWRSTSSRKETFGLVNPASEPGAQMPIIFTSYQAFRDLTSSCQDGGHDLSQISELSVSVYPTSFDSRFWSIHRLQVCVAGRPKEHRVQRGQTSGSNRPSVAVPKPKVELPFGLKPERKRRGEGQRRKPTPVPTKSMRSEPAGLQPKRSVASSDSDELDEEPRPPSQNGNHDDGSGNQVDDARSGEGDDESVVPPALMLPTSTAATEAKAVSEAVEAFEKDARERL